MAPGSVSSPSSARRTDSLTFRTHPLKVRERSTRAGLHGRLTIGGGAGERPGEGRFRGVCLSPGEPLKQGPGGGARPSAGTAMQIDLSRYRVKLAETEAEREGAQRLRYRVFVEEMGAEATAGAARGCAASGTTSTPSSTT